MTTPATAQLSASQQQILNHAAVNTDGKLVWIPETLKGGARKKVFDSLLTPGGAMPNVNVVNIHIVNITQKGAPTWA